MEIEFILYVADQDKSKNFYSKVLDSEPVLHVPGMTEFLLQSNVKLGLMPENGIRKILLDKTPDPANGNGIPRCELYLKVPFIFSYVERALQAGAKMVSEASDRDWGDKVCYLGDPDGHVIAFAQAVD
jgi:catechol 2,3-dioxygenase-like lactoylglutathione lyase family enzyme